MVRPPPRKSSGSDHRQSRWARFDRVGVPARRASRFLFLPEPLPPRRARGLGRGIRDLARLMTDLGTNRRDVPARERRQALRLLLPTARQTLAIRDGCSARVAPVPRVADHVAPLEVCAIRRLLKGKILGKVRVVVSHMQAGQEDIGVRSRDDRGPGWRRQRWTVAGPWHAAESVAPENPQLSQLVGRYRIGCAWITPVQVPGVLEEEDSATLHDNLPAEHRLVEPCEFA